MICFDLNKNNYIGDLIMVLPIGKTGGVGFLKGVTIGNFLVKILKSKNLFTQQTWSDVGLKSP